MRESNFLAIASLMTAFFLLLIMEGYYIRTSLRDDIRELNVEIEKVTDNDFFRERKYIFINTQAPKDTFVMISKNAEWALNGLYGMGSPVGVDARIANIIDLDETWRGF